MYFFCYKGCLPTIILIIAFPILFFHSCAQDIHGLSNSVDKPGSIMEITQVNPWMWDDVDAVDEFKENQRKYETNDYTPKTKSMVKIRKGDQVKIISEYGEFVEVELVEPDWMKKQSKFTFHPRHGYMRKKDLE